MYLGAQSILGDTGSLRPLSKIHIFSYLQSYFEFSLMALKNAFTHPLVLSSNVFCEQEEDNSTFKQDNTEEIPNILLSATYTLHGIKFGSDESSQSNLGRE